MITGLPRRPVQHVTRDAAVTQAKRHLPREWVVRDQNGDTDYGIDLEIELAAGVVTGSLFKAQVKGHDGIKWGGDGTFLQPVRSETLNYWRALPVPVVIFVSDVTAGKTYWAFVDQAIEPSGIRIAKSVDLQTSANTLAVGVSHRLYRRSGWALLNRAPSIEQTWMLLKGREGGHEFLDLDLDLFHPLVNLYEDVFLLRQFVGLPLREIFSWEVWIARSRVAFPSVETIAWGFFDEILAYFGPIVDETLRRSKDVLREMEVTAANGLAKTWADTDSSGRGGTIHWYRSELESAPSEFWKKVESLLEKASALRMPIADHARKEK